VQAGHLRYSEPLLSRSREHVLGEDALMRGKLPWWLVVILGWIAIVAVIAVCRAGGERLMLLAKDTPGLLGGAWYMALLAAHSSPSPSPSPWPAPWSCSPSRTNARACWPSSSSASLAAVQRTDAAAADSPPLSTVTYT